MAQTIIKIGITEQGDAGIDLSWVKKLKNVAGAVLITKNITDEFINHVIYLNNLNYKLIVHCTCTGFGGTELEPNVPEYQNQLAQLSKLIQKGFPISQCVLRIDPIIPTPKGFTKAGHVLDLAAAMGFFNKSNHGGQKLRVRISIMDEYNHVKARFRNKGWPMVYTGFQASTEQLTNVLQFLNQYYLTFEICAENDLYNFGKCYPGLLEVVGCISIKDLSIMNLPNYSNAMINPQNRNGCHCLAGKTELLSTKKQCSNGCVYCYWRS